MRAHPSSLLSKALHPPALIDAWSAVLATSAFRGLPATLQLWNGARCRLSESPVATLIVRDRSTLLRLLRAPALTFGEAYADGHLAFDGDLVEFLVAANHALAGRPYQRRNPHARGASTHDARSNVHVHYDLGNDFYQLWLDEAMVYTCAYFEAPGQSLDAAQRAKLEYVCRKLRLRPGEHVVEAGCGWGALAIHMARYYGVTVDACNISAPQLEFARERAQRLGVGDRVSFINADYRDVDRRADAFVSIGMLEHVGIEHYATLGRVIDRVLDGRHGRALVHFIGRNRPLEFNPWIARYIFPGAYAPTLAEMLPGVCEDVNLSVVDVENLRLHYAETLRHWLARFEAHAGDIAGRFDDRFVRMWRLYLAGARAGFLSGDLQLFQVLVERATDNSRPWTRAGLYRTAAS
jgi:cyclopropane-fatty-acyl-phospholipid synthase